MLDNIRLRKLENGYTIKFHVVTNSDLQNEKGFTSEMYVPSKRSLIEHVMNLIENHIDDDMSTLGQENQARLR